MPRNGSDIYYIPPGTEGFPDTTIESAKYNTYIHDVETDLNRPRPISAGGTGADDADEALANLGAEKSSQEVINYDTHLFLPGSFYSKTTATAGPESGHAFVGFALSSDVPATPPANLNVVIRAYDQSSTVVPGRIWVREKKAGVWSAWTSDSTGAASPAPPTEPPDGYLWWDSIGGHLYVWYNDGNSKQWVIASPFSDPAQFLLKAGDTMTGNLKLSSWPVVNEDAASAGWVNERIASIPAPDLSSRVAKAGDTMTGSLNVTQGSITVSSGSPILAINKTDSSTNGHLLFSTGGVWRWVLFSGQGATDSLNLYRYNDAGSFLGASFEISRTSAAFRINDELRVASGVVRFGNSTEYIQFDGSNWAVQGGGYFHVTATLSSGGVVQSNIGYFHSLQGYAILSATGGPVFFRPYGRDEGTNQAFVNTDGGFHLTGNGSSFSPSTSNGGFKCKNADSNYIAGDYFNFANNSGQLASYIGNVYMGNVAFQSDYRIKKDIEPLPSTWEAVKSLNPIKYTQKAFGETHKADDIERWGFIAHELQETLVESASSGVKDQENCIQAPNPFTIIAALTKALQEAMERIEKLEERI